MSPLQKFAWFNLAVIGFSTLVVLSLMPFLGYRSLGGLGFLGFLGLGVLYFRKRPGQVTMDERDNLIMTRSLILAYALFWVVFVLSAVVVSPLLYGQDGSVPVVLVQMSVAWGFMLWYAVQSIAILVQYAGGQQNAG
jgi:hypothetical protein